MKGWDEVREEGLEAEIPLREHGSTERTRGGELWLEVTQWHFLLAFFHFQTPFFVHSRLLVCVCI